MAKNINYSLEGLAITPEEFLGAFFNPHEIVCVRVFSDKAGSAFSGQKLECQQGRFDSFLEVLQKHNNQDRGIYFVINYGGHEDSEIKRVNAQFMEMDDLPLDEQLAKIQAFALEPSLIVKTRKSLHCYWLINDGKLERFRHIQRQLIAHSGADPSCVNESRVFRIPAFNHCKEEPVLVECIKFNPELRYTQQELENILPAIPEETPSQSPVTHNATPIKDRGTQKGLMAVGLRCQFMRYCKRNAKTLPEPDWYAMITNLALFEGGEEAIHKLSKPYPKYSFEQTQAKIEHFHKSGTKPMTCEKIFQNAGGGRAGGNGGRGGFVCPKYKDGSCKGKSPAGLAYFPLDIADIRKRLAACKVTNSPLEDIATARQLINDYLYNLDAGLAEAFVNHEIKAKFNFKAAELKQLVAFHKETNAAFFKSQQSKRDRQGVELPPWYEYTEKGGLRFMPGVLADYCTKNEDVFYCADSYYFYEDGVYLHKNDMAAERRIRKHMAIDRHKTSSQIADAEHQWKIQIDKPVRDLNANPYLLNLKNGLYNVLTGTLEEHTPKVLSTIRLGGAYDPAAGVPMAVADVASDPAATDGGSAPEGGVVDGGGVANAGATDAAASSEPQCPIFLKYLSEVLPASEIPLIQEIMGYVCVPINKAQKSFVLVGKGDSGKSTLLHTIQEILLGSENVSTLTWHALDDRFSTFQLFGKLANVFADLPMQALKDTGTFKAITGEDYIMGERKHKDGFSFKPFARLVFSCNSIPKNYADRSDGFYRRLILIRFENVIADDKKDHELKEKLALEADGILAWSLAGLKRLMANGYRFSETDRTRLELKKYKADNSTTLAFVDDCCTLDPEAEFLREEMYNAFKEYCNDNGHKLISLTRFNREMDEVGGVTRAMESTTGRRTWRGIKLS